MKWYLLALVSVAVLGACSHSGHWVRAGSAAAGEFRERFVPQDSLPDGKQFLFRKGKFSTIVPQSGCWAVRSARTDLELIEYCVYAKVGTNFRRNIKLTPQSLVVNITKEDKAAFAASLGTEVGTLDNLNELPLILTAVDEERALYSYSYSVGIGNRIMKTIEFYAITELSDNDLPNKKILDQFYVISGDRAE